MKVCPKCGTYMQVGTSGEYCPNGCGWNERINNYRIIPIASDHTELSKELKPCPFCGSDEIHTYTPSPYELGNDASVNCENPICGAEVRGRTLKEAIAKWNRRVGE